jgi:hypothetical protein
MTAITRRIRQHPGFSHVLASGTDLDRSCLSCWREQKADTRPVILISARPAQVMPDYDSGQLSLGATTVVAAG